MQVEILNFLINDKVIHTMLSDTQIEYVETKKWIIAHKHGVKEDDIEVRKEVITDSDLESMVKNLLDTVPSVIDGTPFPKVTLALVPIQGEDF